MLELWASNKNSDLTCQADVIHWGDGGLSAQYAALQQQRMVALRAAQRAEEAQRRLEELQQSEAREMHGGARIRFPHWRNDANIKELSSQNLHMNMYSTQMSHAVCTATTTVYFPLVCINVMGQSINQHRQPAWQLLLVEHMPGSSWKRGCRHCYTDGYRW